jgi:hypothetical protein
LEAEGAAERPFAVELHDGFGAGLAAGGDDVLAGVVAFGGAGPEEEAAVEGWNGGEGWGVRGGGCLKGGWKGG